MKKNNFVKGAFVATLGIILCKILGLVYVIPFYKIIGTQGGALYSYAYSIYAIFLNLSTGGVPIAISKIISEYDALGYKKLQKKAYNIASKFLNIIGFVCFVVLFTFSDKIAQLIIGNAYGGNTLEDISVAIKVVSFALLIVPKLSICRGYFQGNKYFSQSSFSKVFEQLVRVIVIVVGSYVIVKIFNFPIQYAVYIAVFGATIGAIVSYVYLKIKIKKHGLLKKSDEKTDKLELDLTTKDILKKIIFYAVPFVLIELLQSAYGVVDTFTVVRTMSSLGYSTAEAETTIGLLTTWGTKLNMIVVSIALGLTTSLVPNIAGSYAKNNYNDINSKTNKSLKILLYVTLPMAFGISFLSAPIWTVFYGYDTFCIKLFTFSIMPTVFYGIYTTLINISQSMNQTKISLGVLLCSFGLKVILNIPMMHLCYHLGIGAYYGPVFTNIIAEFSSIIITLIIFKKKYNFNFSDVVVPFIKTLVSLLTMLVSLSILRCLYFDVSSLFRSFLTIALFSTVGAVIYCLVSYKLGLVSDVFGHQFLSNIKNKLKGFIHR